MFSSVSLDKSKDCSGWGRLTWWGFTALSLLFDSLAPVGPDVEDGSGWTRGRIGVEEVMREFLEKEILMDLQKRKKNARAQIAKRSTDFEDIFFFFNRNKFFFLPRRILVVIVVQVSVVIVVFELKDLLGASNSLLAAFGSGRSRSRLVGSSRGTRFLLRAVARVSPGLAGPLLLAAQNFFHGGLGASSRVGVDAPIAPAIIISPFPTLVFDLVLYPGNLNA